MPSFDIRFVTCVGLTLSSILFASIGVAQDAVGENDPAIRLQDRLATACKERNLPAIAAPEKGYVILVATNVFSNPARQACDEVAKYLEPIE